MTYSPEETQGHTVVNATRARQGRWGRHIFWVLVISTFLAALTLFAIWAMNAPALDATEPTNVEARKQAQTFDVPAPPPPTN